ncbi:MAG: hypothetical protein CMH57_11835 [Myxococcales bacterium]|nr:hypothetical protein [Myxococcales bacterium]
MTNELESIDEPPAELLAAKAAAEGAEPSPAHVEDPGAEDATVALDSAALLAQLDQIEHEKSLAEGDEEEDDEVAATIAMEMPAALAELDGPPRDPGVEDETVVMDGMSQERLQALASAEVAAIRRDAAPSEEEASIEVDTSAAIGDAIAEAMGEEAEPEVASEPEGEPDAEDEDKAPEANPDLLSAMIDETLAEGSKRIHAIPEEAPEVDIDGVEDVPTIARPEKEAPSSSSGGGAWLAVAIVVILVVAAAGAVFLLPMFGVELPFELPFEHPLAPKK